MNVLYIIKPMNKDVHHEAFLQKARESPVMNAFFFTLNLTFYYLLIVMVSGKEVLS